MSFFFFGPKRREGLYASQTASDNAQKRNGLSVSLKHKLTRRMKRSIEKMTGANQVALLVWMRQCFYHEDPQRSGFLSKKDFLKVVESLPNGKTLTDPEEQELVDYCGVSEINDKLPYDAFIHLLGFEDPEIDVLAQTMRNAVRAQSLDHASKEQHDRDLNKTKGTLTTGNALEVLEKTKGERMWRSKYQQHFETTLDKLLEEVTKLKQSKVQRGKKKSDAYITMKQLNRLLRDLEIRQDFDKDDLAVVHKLFHPVESADKQRYQICAESFVWFLMSQVHDIFVPRSKGPIERIAISFNEEEEKDLLRRHYNIVPQNLHPHSTKQPVYLWHLKGEHDNPITAIIIHKSNEDETLSAEGFKCVGRGIEFDGRAHVQGRIVRKVRSDDEDEDDVSNDDPEDNGRDDGEITHEHSRTTDVTPTYLWCKRRSRAETVDEGIGIVDLAVTMGDVKNPKSKIHVAPSVDYQLIRGNLRSRSVDDDLFLWVRQQMKPSVREALVVLQKWCRKIARVENQPGKMNYKRAWDLLDADHSGVVPLDEFEKFLETQNIGTDLDMTERAALLAHLDRSQNDELNYEEFVAFVREKLPEESGAVAIMKRKHQRSTRRTSQRRRASHPAVRAPTRSTPQLSSTVELLRREIRSYALDPRTGTYDFRKPFDLFDTNKNGTVPIDEFTAMLEELDIGSDLSLQEMHLLMGKLEAPTSGEIDFESFRAFAEVQQDEQDLQLFPGPQKGTKLRRSTRGVFRLTVKSAKGLDTSGVIGDVDPYVRAWISPQYDSKGAVRTRHIVNGGKNPTWPSDASSTIALPIELQKSTTPYLYVQIFDYDPTHRDNKLAWGAWPLTEFFERAERLGDFDTKSDDGSQTTATRPSKSSLTMPLWRDREMRPDQIGQANRRGRRRRHEPGGALMMDLEFAPGATEIGCQLDSVLRITPKRARGLPVAAQHGPKWIRLQLRGVDEDASRPSSSGAAHLSEGSEVEVLGFGGRWSSGRLVRVGRTFDVEYPTGRIDTNVNASKIRPCRSAAAATAAIASRSGLESEVVWPSNPLTLRCRPHHATLDVELWTRIGDDLDATDDSVPIAWGRLNLMRLLAFETPKTASYDVAGETKAGRASPRRRRRRSPSPRHRLRDGSSRGRGKRKEPSRSFWLPLRDKRGVGNLGEILVTVEMIDRASHQYQQKNDAIDNLKAGTGTVTVRPMRVVSYERLNATLELSTPRGLEATSKQIALGTVGPGETAVRGSRTVALPAEFAEGLDGLLIPALRISLRERSGAEIGSSAISLANVARTGASELWIDLGDDAAEDELSVLLSVEYSSDTYVDDDDDVDASDSFARQGNRGGARRHRLVGRAPSSRDDLNAASGFAAALSGLRAHLSVLRLRLSAESDDGAHVLKTTARSVIRNVVPSIDESHLDELLYRCSESEERSSVTRSHGPRIDFELLLTLCESASPTLSSSNTEESMRHLVPRIRRSAPMGSASVHRIFERYDSRNVGTVSPHDLKSALVALCGDALSERDLDIVLRFTASDVGDRCDYVRLLSALDGSFAWGSSTDATGSSSYAAIDRSKPTRTQMNRLLRPFYESDLEGAGKVSRRDFREICRGHPQLFPSDLVDVDTMCNKHRHGSLSVDYESFCRDLSQRLQRSSGSPRGGPIEAAVTGEGAIWRRLRRWAQDLAVRGVRLRQSLQHAEPSRGRFASGTLSRRAFRDCLTDLGAPVRGEREWLELFDSMPRAHRPGSVDYNHFMRSIQPKDGSESTSAEDTELRQRFLQCVYRPGSPYSASQLRNIFLPFDRLKNCCVSSGRFETIVRQLVGSTVPLYPDEMKRLREMFCDGWDRVNYDRFVRWATYGDADWQDLRRKFSYLFEKVPPTRLFEQYDARRRGRISAHEFRSAIQRLSKDVGVAISETDLEVILQRFGERHRNSRRILFDYVGFEEYLEVNGPHTDEPSSPAEDVVVRRIRSPSPPPRRRRRQYVPEASLTGSRILLSPTRGGRTREDAPVMIASTSPIRRSRRFGFAETHRSSSHGLRKSRRRNRHRASRRSRSRRREHPIRISHSK